MISKPAYFIYNRRQNLKLVLLSWVRERMNTYSFPLFRYVHSAFISLTEHYDLCSIVSSLFFFLGVLPVLTEAT